MNIQIVGSKNMRGFSPGSKINTKTLVPIYPYDLKYEFTSCRYDIVFLLDEKDRVLNFAYGDYYKQVDDLYIDYLHLKDMNDSPAEIIKESKAHNQDACRITFRSCEN
jgi:hypothetical protein